MIIDHRGQKYLNPEYAVMKRIAIVVGTRPNFIKITQFPAILKKYSDKLEFKVIHTGQHFDDKMSKVFFQQFGIEPDIYLNVKGETIEVQAENTKIALGQAFKEYCPDLVIVVGDVNSTAWAAVTAQNMKIKVAHVESGLRSYDNSMPEELNRILTDNIAEYFFVTEQSGVDNLIREGKPRERIFFVGNTMIDTMVAFRSQIQSSDVLSRLSLQEKQFVLMTMHRPATVDSKEGLIKLIDLIADITKKYKVVFPIHPRTISKLSDFGLKDKLLGNKNLVVTEPLDYFSFQKLIQDCKFILTDSGGIQEESTFLQVPCLTLRPNTERPSTVEQGTNELIPFELPLIRDRIKAIEEGTYKKGNIPPMWDGKASQRIIELLVKLA